MSVDPHRAGDALTAIPRASDIGADLHRSGDDLADRRADYAADLAEKDDPAAAADVMRQALDLAPRWVAGWVALGGHLEAAGRSAEATQAYRTALGLDGADGHGAGLKLALLGASPVPGTAPPAFVRGLFDQYADRFEASLVGRLGYDAPAHLMAALAAAAGPGRRYGDVLDLGCGTGLMGERLRPIADRLSGIDLSPAMVEKARRKAVYDRLAVGDIAHAPEPDAAHDLVTAADVFIYIGDLRPVFARVSSQLSPGGLFAFTVEAHDGDAPYVVGPSLRFAHSRAGLAALARAEGFEVRHEARIVLRQDRGAAVEGFVFVLEGTEAGRHRE